MKTKHTTAFFALLLILFCIITAIPASAEDGFVDAYYRLSDMAGLLTETEYANLLDTLDEISIRQRMDVCIVTAEDLDGFDTATEYADYAYEYCQFGYGESRDGILFLLSMEDRDWAISTCGYGITAFTDAGMQYIMKQMRSDLANDNFAAAFATFAEQCDAFITQAHTGAPYDKQNLPREPLSALWFIGALVLGVASALAIVSGMKGKLKTVRYKAAADGYVKKDSLQLRENNDLFLYHTVSKTPKASDSNKDSSDSGSSTHTSSSGTTHGGASGKF